LNAESDISKFLIPLKFMAAHTVMFLVCIFGTTIFGVDPLNEYPDFLRIITLKPTSSTKQIF
jgi:hypothetical protein